MQRYSLFNDNWKNSKSSRIYKYFEKKFKYYDEEF